jgi:predicted dehydrogenase
VTNEDYAGLLAVFEMGVHGTFESSRSMVGPESQMAFDVYGTRGALSWSLERLNELQVYVAGEEPLTGYTTVLGGDRFPPHGNFVPGNANGIGFEDLIAIEDHAFLDAVARGESYEPGFAAALDYVAVQAALIRSWESGSWENVVPIASLEAIR